jgi:hypothetical protein
MQKRLKKLSASQVIGKMVFQVFQIPPLKCNFFMEERMKERKREREGWHLKNRDFVK